MGCETGVSTIGLVMYQLDYRESNFINNHLLSMLGLPDAAGDIWGTLSRLGEAVNDFIDFWNFPLTPSPPSRTPRPG